MRRRFVTQNMVFWDQELLPSGYVKIAMENHHCLWENPLFLWSFSIAMLNYQRVDGMNLLHYVSRSTLSLSLPIWYIGIKTKTTHRHRHLLELVDLQNHHFPKPQGSRSQRGVLLGTSSENPTDFGCFWVWVWIKTHGFTSFCCVQTRAAGHIKRRRNLQPLVTKTTCFYGDLEAHPTDRKGYSQPGRWQVPDSRVLSVNGLELS